MPTVSAENLTMMYRAPVRESGLRAAVTSLVRPRFRAIKAVHALSFELDAGEVVGFIGPNGAGKTSSLKMLSGVLHPTAGDAAVLGFRPWRREPAYLRQIAMIRGSRPLAVPAELTVLDALRFQRLIYEVPRPDFDRTLAHLADMLDLTPLLPRQVRALSLGERMRAGLAWSLVHRPRVLFLDEPTLGLDVTAVGIIRRFIADYGRETGATILLTSHSMADVERLCKRVIVVDRGRLAYDGDLARLVARLSPDKLVSVTVDGRARPDWPVFGDVVEAEGPLVRLRVRRDRVSAVTAQLLAELPVLDLAVTDPPLESVIDRIFREGVE